MAQRNPAKPQMAEGDRLELLERAAREGLAGPDPVRALEKEARRKAVELLGGEAVFGRPICNDEELMQALMAGLPALVLSRLLEAGLPHRVLERVIAPRRTLMRRRAEAQRLTRGESDAAWRLAHVLALAGDVLSGPESAIAWLMRSKPVFGDRTPVDLLETSIGAAHVERLLRALDWGDVA